MRATAPRRPVSSSAEARARSGRPSSSRDRRESGRPPIPPREFCSSTASWMPWCTLVPWRASAPVRGLMSPMTIGSAAWAAGPISDKARSRIRAGALTLLDHLLGLGVEEVDALGHEGQPELLVGPRLDGGLHPGDHRLPGRVD